MQTAEEIVTRKSIYGKFIGTVLTAWLLSGMFSNILAAADLPLVWRDISPEKRLQIVRVAQIDAYRALAERIYGFKIDGGTSVYEYMLHSDKIKSSINQILRGATETEEPEFTKNGIVQVVYGVALDDVMRVIAKNTGRKLPAAASSGKLIEAIGSGAIPNSRGMKLLRAKRAAELDAYRKMAERFVGIRLDGKSSVRDYCLKNDKVQGAVSAFLQGLKPVAIDFKPDGTCQVTMQLKIREVIETVETIVKTGPDGKKITGKELRKVNRDFNDRTFTVTGSGAPGSMTEEPAKAEDVFDPEKRIERIILKKLITKEIVTE